MRNEFTEKWGDIYRSMSKPMVELTELNVKTLNRWAKNAENLEDILQAKKPDDMLAAQVKLANTAGLEVLKYTQEAAGILMEAASLAGKVFTDMMKETATKASDAVVSGVKEKERH